MMWCVGAVLAIVVALFAAVLGLDRDRALYPCMLIVIASYDVLFASMGAPPLVLYQECFIFLCFVVLAVAGFKRSLWWVVLGLIAHGVFDLVHDALLINRGIPAWWPRFCFEYDMAAAAALAFLIRRRSKQAPVARQ